MSNKLIPIAAVLLAASLVLIAGCTGTSSTTTEATPTAVASANGNATAMQGPQGNMTMPQGDFNGTFPDNMTMPQGDFNGTFPDNMTMPQGDFNGTFPGNMTLPQNGTMPIGMRDGNMTGTPPGGATPSVPAS